MRIDEEYSITPYPNTPPPLVLTDPPFHPVVSLQLTGHINVAHIVNVVVVDIQSEEVDTDHFGLLRIIDIVVFLNPLNTVAHIGDYMDRLCIVE
jgi:hypothetical protein